MKPMDHNQQQDPPEGNDARRKSLLENLYACPKCTKSFASGRALGGHLASHQRHDKMVEKEAAAAAAASRGLEMGHLVPRMLAGRVPPEQAPSTPPPLPFRVPTLYNFMNLHPSLLYGNEEATPPSSESKLPAWMDSANPAANGGGESSYANYSINSSESGGGSSSRNFHGTASAAHNGYYPYAREGQGEFGHSVLFAVSHGGLLQTIDFLSQMDTPLPVEDKGGDDDDEGELDLTLRL